MIAPVGAGRGGGLRLFGKEGLDCVVTFAVADALSVPPSVVVERVGPRRLGDVHHVPHAVVVEVVAVLEAGAGVGAGRIALVAEGDGRGAAFVDGAAAAQAGRRRDVADGDDGGVLAGTALA